MKKVNKVSMVYIFDSLNSLGFEMKFKATVHGLLSLTTPKTFQPYQIQIVHFYRFEGESDPSDSSIVYAIETNDGEKGTLVDGYSTSGDSQVTDFVQQVKGIHK